MRYRLLFILLFFYCNSAFSQGSFDDSVAANPNWKVAPLFIEDSNIVYKEEVMLNATYTKERLFSSALSWFNYNYSNKGMALTINDNAGGRLAGKGIIQYKSSYNGNPETIYFTFEIAADYGKYNYKVYNITGMPGNLSYSAMYTEEAKPSATQRWDHTYRYEMLSDMETYLKILIAQLKERMSK